MQFNKPLPQLKMYIILNELIYQLDRVKNKQRN